VNVVGQERSRQDGIDARMVIVVYGIEEGPGELVGSLRRGRRVKTVQARRHRGCAHRHDQAPVINT
jgi:hypothetical protein